MTVFELTNATIVRDGRPVFQQFNWTVREGEAWAVVGPTGSGKTTLAEALLGRHSLHGGALAWPLFDRLRAAGRRADYASQVIGHVTFKEDSRLFSYAGRYYQQRFEFADSDSDTPLSLDRFLRTGTHAPEARRAALHERLGIAGLVDQPFMTLSNGQTRRARLARALLAEPELLVLDDPFIGLDAAARADFAALLGELVRDGKRVVLICRADTVPAWVTNVLELPRQPTPPAPPPEGRGGNARDASSDAPEASGLRRSCSPPFREGPGVGSAPIELRDVTVTHAGHTILDRVSWTVRAGERWAVLGPNGSGKSTLLSLLCGDHPQAYANDVNLFGRRRGSGETIWDVKRNVGLLSPEFHLYFTEPLTAARTVATGFFDALADRPTTPEQGARIRELLAAFGIAHLADRTFKQLSTGEQRLVLLARALVKRPPLVILDEPFQGMDADATTHCREWLDRELGADQTLLFVTHEPSELPRSVSQTLRLARGRVV
ncbi:ATP-binding cassette domain-containing protein [Frigoriglobus tundricola]|uniref:Molybdenum transport ATP-binding protein modF n=1 Tax=Frigoriglobus tundricola TaxID=2774151 RepID=A0A6M5YJG0_9BACT|nr:ATP-binding cassette domain-containing protein [Frigoriglobus tundricola]QJW93406.1 Putative molybdenum transport ATP-binding protein modF [Frigoriglobus tundricola]